jgi:hypothetical protein
VCVCVCVCACACHAGKNTRIIQRPESSSAGIREGRRVISLRVPCAACLRFSLGFRLGLKLHFIADSPSVSCQSSFEVFGFGFKLGV